MQAFGMQTMLTVFLIVIWGHDISPAQSVGC